MNEGEGGDDGDDKACLYHCWMPRICHVYVSCSPWQEPSLNKGIERIVKTLIADETKLTLAEIGAAVIDWLNENGCECHKKMPVTRLAAMIDSTIAHYNRRADKEPKTSSP